MGEVENQANQRKTAASHQVDVVLPAGGRLTGEFARASGQEVKALLSFQGQTVLRRTIEVLRVTGRIGKIVVIGPEAAQKEAESAGADAALPEGESGPENFFRGLDWLKQNLSAAEEGGAENPVLIVATDLPFLTADAISRFLATCPPTAAVCVPVMARAAMEARFPGLPGAYVPLREGPMTTGCAFLVRPEVLRRNRTHIEAIFAARKSEIAMARLLGLSFLLKYALRRLSVRDIEAQCRRILDCSGAAILASAPELAFDMDTPEEYAYAMDCFVKLKNEEPDYARI